MSARGCGADFRSGARRSSSCRPSGFPRRPALPHDGCSAASSSPATVQARLARWGGIPSDVAAPAGAGAALSLRRLRRLHLRGVAADAAQRFDLLLDALADRARGIRAVIAGEGEARDAPARAAAPAGARGSGAVRGAARRRQLLTTWPAAAPWPSCRSTKTTASSPSRRSRPQGRGHLHRQRRADRARDRRRDRLVCAPTRAAVALRLRR